MTAWLRRAGRGRLPGESVVVWSVAEGARGRRWRWTVIVDGRSLSAALLEQAPDGAFGRLELATDAGLLTFHPEPDLTMAHGNVVTDAGVSPIAVAWARDLRVGLAADPFGSALAGWGGRGLVVARNLSWRPPALHADVTALACDARGVPVLDEAAEWALEE